MTDLSHTISLNIDLLNFLFIKVNFIFHQVFAAFQLYKYEKGKTFFILIF